jgi:hypothetical protein
MILTLVPSIHAAMNLAAASLGKILTMITCVQLMNVMKTLVSFPTHL